MKGNRGAIPFLGSGAGYIIPGGAACNEVGNLAFSKLDPHYLQCYLLMAVLKTCKSKQNGLEFIFYLLTNHVLGLCNKWNC